jgi:hypothetical protein
MSAFSDYLEDKIADAVFRGASFPTITNIHIGLASAAPTDGGTFNELPSSNAYARVQVAASTAQWGALGADVANVNAITFPTATGDWPQATHFFIADSGTHNSGNLLYKAALTANRTVTNGGTASFSAGELDVTHD